MKATTKPDKKSSTRREARRTPRSVSAAIARFADEFMLKPGERGFDAVGELVKARRAP